MEKVSHERHGVYVTTVPGRGQRPGTDRDVSGREAHKSPPASPPGWHILMKRKNRRQRNSRRQPESPSRGGDRRPRADFSQRPGGRTREACHAQRAEGPGGPGTPRPTSGPPGRRAAQTPGQTGLLCSAAVTSHARWGPPRGEGPVPTRNAKSQRRDGHREARRTVRVRAPAPTAAGGESLITPARRLTGKEVKITTQRSVFLRYTL